MGLGLRSALKLGSRKSLESFLCLSFISPTIFLLHPAFSPPFPSYPFPSPSLALPRPMSLSLPSFLCFSGSCGQSNRVTPQCLSLHVMRAAMSQRPPSDQVWPRARVILFQSGSWRSLFCMWFHFQRRAAHSEQDRHSRRYLECLGLYTQTHLEPIHSNPFPFN